MKREKLKATMLFTAVLVFVVGSLFVVSSALKAADPSGVHMTVYQTDLMTGASGSPVTIFTSSSGATVDIVGNPDVFGQGAVPVGTYKRIKFTVKNLVDFAGPDPCSGGTTTVSASFKIDSGQPDTAQVPVYFATSDDGGSSGWTANGSPTNPFLIQNPITIDANGTYIVRLIFNTTGTLICGQGNTPMVAAPTMNVMSYADVAPSAGGYCASLGDYWFFHYRIASYPTDSTGSLIQNPTLTQIMQSGTVDSGWGSMSFSAPDPSTGAGTWTIDPTKTYETGGLADHRHSLYDNNGTGWGYFDPDGGPAVSASYSLKGNNMLMTFPGQFTIDGSMSADCSTFVGVNFDQKEGSDLIVAVKKAASQPSIPANAVYVSARPGATIRYNGNNIADYFGYDIKWGGFRFGTTTTSNDGVMMEWGNPFQMSPDWAGAGSLSILPMSEDVHMNTALNLQFTIRTDGLVTQMLGTTPEDFGAIDVNGNGIFAGGIGDTSVKDPGYHELRAGLLVRTSPSTTLSDVVGTWYIGALESHVSGTTDWKMGVIYGKIVISLDSNGNAKGNGNLTFRDNFSGELNTESFSNASVELHTECYAWDSATNTGLPVSTAAASCIIPNSSTPGITMPVFTLIDTTNGGSTTKFALDNSRKVMIIWKPFDTDETPCTTNGGGTCTPDPASKALGGVGVKVQ